MTYPHSPLHTSPDATLFTEPSLFGIPYLLNSLVLADASSMDIPPPPPSHASRATLSTDPPPPPPPPSSNATESFLIH